MQNYKMKIAGIRGLLSEEDVQKVDWLSRGVDGESEMLSMIKAYGSPEWLICQNLWLEHSGWAEADILVMSPHRWQIFEVKNYNASVQIQQGEVFLYGKALNKNPIHQVSKARQILISLANQLSFKIEVKATLVFINEFCHVQCDDYQGTIDIIARSQIRDYLYQMNKDMLGRFNGKQVKEINNWIDRNRKENPFSTFEIPAEKLSQMRRGVTCEKCASYDVYRNKKFVICQECEHNEPLYMSLIRMIRDYVVLTEKEIVNVRDIRWFVGEFYSENFIPRIMGDKFQKAINGKRGDYIDCYVRCQKLLDEYLKQV